MWNPYFLSLPGIKYFQGRRVCVGEDVRVVNPNRGVVLTTLALPEDLRRKVPTFTP